MDGLALRGLLCVSEDLKLGLVNVDELVVNGVIIRFRKSLSSGHLEWAFVAFGHD
jgi:hypothetical protein